MSILVEGQRFERYRVLRLLGSGVTGESYEVENLVLQQKATLKLIHPWATLAEAARRQFFREMQGICRLRHPYLAEVIDYGEIDAQLYVARRYMSSGSLLGAEGRLWFRPPLPVAEAIQYTCQLAQSLDYVHQQGYNHGALTLSNILVLRGANVEHAADYAPFLLADVGLAHFARRFGQPKLSLLPLTAAPEQLGGRLTPASDQFALAVILYLWLAGRPPYLGSPEEIEHLKLTETIAPLSSFNPAVTFEQEGVLRRALAVYPEDRYPSLQAFANALTATRTLKPIPVTPEPEPVAEVAYEIVPHTTLEPPHESDAATTSETTAEDSPIFADGYEAESVVAVELVETIGGTMLPLQLREYAEIDSPIEPAATLMPLAPDTTVEPVATPLLAEADATIEPVATPVLIEADSIAEPPTELSTIEGETAIQPVATLTPVEADNTVEPLATPLLAEHDVIAEPAPAPLLAERDGMAEPAATPVLLADTSSETEPETPEPLPEPEPDIVTPIPEPEHAPEPLPAPAPEPVSPQIVPPTEPEPVTEPLTEPAPDIFTPLPEPEPPPKAAAITRPLAMEKGEATATQQEEPVHEQCEQQAVARLVIISPFTGMANKVLLEGDELTIGRAGSSDILLDFDDKTSRHHALLRREDGLYVLYDRQSANGVFVNGQKIPVEADIGCPLSNGDRIHIGNYELRFFVEALAENFIY